MSRGRQRRARRAKKRRASAQRSRLGQRAASPAEDAVAEALERFAGYVQLVSSRVEAARVARADMRAAVEKLIRLARGLDVIKVVSSVRVSVIMGRAVIGADPSAAILELVALALVCRDSSSTSEVVATTPESDFLPPNVEAAAQEALGAGSMIALFDSPSSGPESEILFRSIQREISLRNSVYPHMLLDTLPGLFGDPTVNDDCRATLGFTDLEAINVMEAVSSLSIEELTKRFARMEAARDASLPYIRSWQEHDTDEPQLPTEEHRAAAQEVFDAVVDLTTNIAPSSIRPSSPVVLRSPSLEIELQPGEQVNLMCRARGSLWEGIALAWGKPSRYLQLQWTERKGGLPHALGRLPTRQVVTEDWPHPRSSW